MRTSLAASGETPASHRDGRGAPIARRDDREYREYSREEQRRERGCLVRRMQRGFHHRLLAGSLLVAVALAAASPLAQQPAPAPAAAKPDDKKDEDKPKEPKWDVAAAF